MKRLVRGCTIFVILLGLAFCSGCGTVEEKDDSLWVLADVGESRLIDKVAQSFQQAHPDVPLRIEYVPRDAGERELYLERVRTKIMAGQGPDVFWLNKYSEVFSNVEQSMHNGLFLDISAYYDEDTALPKDGFAQSIMEVGVVDGARYILPLRYNFPVLYVDTQQLASAGISLDALGRGLTGLFEVIQKLGKTAVTADVTQMEYYYLQNFFSELIDCEAQKVTWTKSQLVEFLTQYRELLTLVQGEYIPWIFPSIGEYISNNKYLGQEGTCIYWGTLYDLVDIVRVSKVTGREIAIIPMTAYDGSVCAQISHLGAIGANTDKAELAYEFLSAFLLRENQWENGLGDRGGYLTTQNWPVLVKDSWVQMDEDIWQGQMGGAGSRWIEGSLTRRAAVAATTVTAEDYAILNTEISKVYLPLACADEIMMTIRQQLNPYLNPDAASVDVEALADQLIQQLQWLVAEG